MHVVMVSKALVIGAYQRKLEEISRSGCCELTAIVPASWEDRQSPAKLERAHTQGYRLIVAPIALNGKYHLHFYPTLGRLLRDLHPDILHMDEEPYNPATWLAMRTAQKTGARSLFFTWQNISRRYPWPYSAFERANYRRADYAIAGSQTAAKVIRRKGFAGRIAVIPQFGVDPDIFSPATAVEADVPALGAMPEGRGAGLGDFTIGFAGRLVPEKGLDVLVRACASLLFPWRLHLLGSGPDHERLALLARELGVADRIRFLGRTPSTRVVDFYRTLDVVVLPSLRRPNWMEQFGRVLIEAMACQVAVIGSASGEIPHVIGDAGFIFPEGDVSDLARLLTQLFANPSQRANLAARGRARVLEFYTHARVAGDTCRVYRDMAAA